MTLSHLKAALLALLLTVAVQAQENFLQRDADGNGRLTTSEAGLSPEEFQKLDTSGNGELSLGEFDDYWNKVARAPDVEDQPYSQESSRQVFDLYLPEDRSGPTPLFVWIHGGSWKEGSKQACQFQTLTDHGVAVASIEYRLTDEARFPAQLQDCQAAIQSISELGRQRGFTFNRVTACGLSAGGHLSLLLAGKGSVANAIAFGAPVDLTPEEAQNGYRDTLERLVGSPLEEHQDELRQASPIYNPGPSCLYILVHGTGDRLVPYQQALLMTGALAAQDIPVELFLNPRGGHTLTGGPRVWDRIVALFRL